MSENSGTAEHQICKCELCDTKYTRKYNLNEHYKTLRHRLKAAEKIMNENKNYEVEIKNTLKKNDFIDYLIEKYPNHILSLKNIIDIVVNEIQENVNKFDEKSIDDLLNTIQTLKQYEIQQTKTFNYTFESLKIFDQ